MRNNRLLMTRYDGLVAAIDLASSVRATAWQEMMPGLSTSTFRNGRYYIGGIGGEVVAIDPDNGGRQVWRTITAASVVSIVAGETTLYVGGSEGRVTALDASSGEILWHDKPLFSRNHTCARIRDLIERLSRRTWCTTKLIERLQMLLDIFMCHFNKRLSGHRRPRLDAPARNN